MKGNREKTQGRKVRQKSEGGREPGRESESKGGEGPVRMCGVTRARYPQGALLRFVKGPDGVLVEDVSGRLPGHGLYVVPTVDSIGRLLKKNASAADLETVVRRCGVALSRRFLEGLGLARRAGVIRRGLRELEGLLDAGERPFLIVATDMAANTRQKLEGLLHRYRVDGWVEMLDSETLGAACGWSQTVILAVNDLGLAQRLKNDAARWRMFHHPEQGMQVGS
ncbi:MAG: DUF448 domain-containing protein [Magnetococcus sp. THC-1_WYH]